MTLVDDDDVEKSAFNIVGSLFFRRRYKGIPALLVYLSAEQLSLDHDCAAPRVLARLNCCSRLGWRAPERCGRWQKGYEAYDAVRGSKPFDEAVTTPSSHFHVPQSPLDSR